MCKWRPVAPRRKPTAGFRHLKIVMPVAPGRILRGLFRPLSVHRKTIQMQFACEKLKLSHWQMCCIITGMTLCCKHCMLHGKQGDLWSEPGQGQHLYPHPTSHQHLRHKVILAYRINESKLMIIEELITILIYLICLTRTARHSLRAAQGHEPSGARGASGGAEAWALISANLDLHFIGNFTVIRFHLVRFAWHPYV